jgi:predicted transcriptional regulator
MDKNRRINNSSLHVRLGKKLHNMKLNIIQKSLKLLGLNEFEILLYETIMSGYNQNVTSIAKILSSERSKIYKHSQKLQELELIIIKKDANQTILNTTSINLIYKKTRKPQIQSSKKHG